MMTSFFNTAGTIVYVETHVQQIRKLITCQLSLMLTGDNWDPVNVGLGRSREQAEM
jgi:hypothetical protein